MATEEEFDFEWKSTPTERYDTYMMKVARLVLMNAGLTVTEEWGGTALGESTEEELTSDNGLSAVTTLGKAAKIAEEMSRAVGHPVKVTGHLEEA